ncbi:MAG: hypothetical protein KOO62_04015 [candidate division Zixibacteria bacterium]|nr:hypothetical protein [candidate division Zixibacteria bacterium]
MHTYITSLLFGLVAVTLCFSTSDASRRKHEKPPKKQIEIKHSVLTVIPSLTVGGLTHIGNGRLVYGAGMALELTASLNARIGINVDALYATQEILSSDKIRGIGHSWSLCWLFTPKNRTSYFLNGKLGTIEIKELESTDDARKYTFFEIGLGHRVYSRSTISNRFEVYFRRILTYEHKFLWYSHFKHNVIVAGVRLSVAFGL